MSILTTNVHHVVAASLDRIKFDGFCVLRITLTTADGGTFQTDAFSPEPLSLTFGEERSALPEQPAITNEVTA